MRSNAEIKRKVMMMSSPNWPEGQAAVDLLKPYASGEKKINEESLRTDVFHEIEKAWSNVVNSKRVEARLNVIKIQVMAWLIDDDDYGDFVAEIVEVGMDDDYIYKKLVIASEYFGFVKPGDKSEVK